MTWPGELSRADLGVAFIDVQGARKDQRAITEGQDDADVAETRTKACHDPPKEGDQRSQNRILRVPKHVSNRVQRIQASNRAPRVGFDRARHDEQECEVRHQAESEYDGEPTKEENSKERALQDLWVCK